MPLSDDDVREILRLIDDAELEELRIETEGLSLHVVRADRLPRSSRKRRASGRSGTRRKPRPPRSPAPAA
jgi:hypothetical protein